MTTGATASPTLHLVTGRDGHDVTFTVYQVDERHDRLTAALSDHAGPG